MLLTRLVLNVEVKLREAESPSIESIIGARRGGEYPLECVMITPNEELTSVDVWS